MDTVVPFALPKQDLHRHRRIEYTVTFVPETREWEWSFSVVTTTTLSHRHDTYDEAMATARAMIDSMDGVHA